MGVRVFHDLASGLRDCDVIVTLRLQQERMAGALLPSGNEYFRLYGLTEARLKAAKPDAIVMHPGPINRGVEIDSSVADGSRSVILQQVSHGIAVRMGGHGHGHGHGGDRGARTVSTLHIRGGRLVDPANGVDVKRDVYVAEGRVAAIGRAPRGFKADRVIDAGDQIVMPGIVDLSVRTREPSASVASEVGAAAAGGITTVCFPPDTRPIIDTPAAAETHSPTRGRGRPCARGVPGCADTGTGG